MKITKSSLDTGLRILNVPMSSIESVTLTVWVGTGSRSENAKVSGISHFLEHMAFKGGKKYKDAKAVAEAVDSIGGEFNAGTSKEWTNFYIRAHKQHLEKCFDVLSDMLLSPKLSTEDIEREKGVIIEEMNMYEDAPMYKIGDIFENLIFKGHALERDIIGNKKSVTALKKKDFVDYRDNYYHADNMIVSVSGGVTDREVEKLTKKYFGKVSGKGKSQLDIFKATKGGSKILLKNKKVDQVHMILAFNGSAYGGNDRYVESVMSAVLGGGMSSRLFTEVREKRGLAYSVRADVGHYQDTGYFGCHAGLDQTRIDEATKVILDEFYKITTKSISEAELKKDKEYLKGHLALQLESTKAINSFLAIEELMLGRTRTPEEVYKGIDNVTPTDIKRVASEIFVKDNLHLAIIGPFRDKSRFEKLIS